MTHMWMTDPPISCDRHLLGEHKECHQADGTLNKKMNIDGYISGGCIEPKSIKKRHDELTIELKRRGMNHNSPLEKQADISYLPKEHQDYKINPNQSLWQLLNEDRNCWNRNPNHKSCREKIIDYLFKKYQSLIATRAWKWCNNSAFKYDLCMSHEDLVSIGYEVFLQAIKEWDWKRGSFCTLLYSMLNNRFNVLSKYRKFTKKANIDIEHLCQSNTFTDDLICFNQIIQSLSPNAQFMINSTLNTPIELIRQAVEETGFACINKKRIQRYLIEHENWTIYDYRKTVDEISNALKTGPKKSKHKHYDFLYNR